jgi:TolA-binding protein
VTRFAGLAEPPAPPVDADDEPVTRGELRMLRRWIVVAAVWAVAATVVALVALLDDSGRAAERRSNETGQRVALSEARVNARLDQAEARLRAMRGQANQDRAEVAALQRRVTALEKAQDSGGGDSGGSGLPSLRDLFP